MEALQREIVDERKERFKFLERTGVESIGVLGLSAGLRMPSSSLAFNSSAQSRDLGIPPSHQENFVREIPSNPTTQNLWRRVTVPRAVTSSFRSRELEWRRTHMDTLKQFENEWVVLEGEEIVAHGSDPAEVIREAREKGIRKPYVFFVEQKNENVVRIGL